MLERVGSLVCVECVSLLGYKRESERDRVLLSSWFFLEGVKMCGQQVLLGQGAVLHHDRSCLGRAPYEAFGRGGRAVGAVGAACGTFQPVWGVSTDWLAGQSGGSARGCVAHRGLSLASRLVVGVAAPPSTPV